MILFLYMLKLQARDTEKNNGIRAQGMVPGIIYGHGQEDKFSVSYIEMEKVMREGCFFNKTIEVELNGSMITVLPKAAQAHVVNDRILHLELQRVNPDQEVQVSVPVHCINQDKSEAIKRGAAVHHALPFLKIRCKAGVIPRAVTLDVSELTIGQTIKVGQLSHEVQVMHSATLTIVKLTGKKEKPAAEAKGK